MTSFWKQENFSFACPRLSSLKQCQLMDFIIDKSRYLYLVKIIRLETRYITSVEVLIRYDSTCPILPKRSVFPCVELFFLTFTFNIYNLYDTSLFFTGCSCVVYSSSDRPQGGTFTSPDYPKRYPPNIDCLLYTFIGHPDEIVVLRFHHFNIRRIWPE